METKNPLLKTHGLPCFADIKPEHVEPAIDEVLAENRQAIKALTSSQKAFSWENLVDPLSLLDDQLSRVWSPVRHLNSVMNSEALREAYNACLPKLSDYATEMGQNMALFKAYEDLAGSPEFKNLHAAQQTVINHALRDFRLSGVDLPEERKIRYREIAQELSRLTAKYEENVLDSTQAWQQHVGSAEALSGLPEYALNLLAQNARQRELEGFLITLEFPSYYAIMTFADDRALRETVYTAYCTRASDQGPHDAAYDNSETMNRILALRHEQARLLGFSSYAHLSLATKMAKTPEEVIGFLEDLAERAVPAARRELEELSEFAAQHLQLEDLQPWDIGYAAEKLRKQAYDLSQEDLKPYFPADHVVRGLFTLVEKLFAVRIQEKTGIPVWHEDVRYYEILDKESSAVRAGFYFDLYARRHKRGGAWMDVCLNRMRVGEQLQLPVAYMTCNSTPPVDGKPALFTHDEVLTLFHEFGHGLHHMLTQVDCADVAGINGVEWDAVELPSQFMENWCWEREALDMFAAHHETGERLPQELFDKLIATRHFQAAMQLVRQLEFALFDMRLHGEYDPERGARIQETLDRIRAQVAVVKPPSFNRFQHGFSHIFAGGYAAGYYSYKWAEVLSADAFARFEEEGLFNPHVGESFLQQILEQGGSRPAIESFKAFRGREPDIEALLRHSGLAA